MALTVDQPQNTRLPAAATDIVAAVREMNRSELASTDRQLTFTWDSQNNRPVIKIVKRDSGEVIEEIPPEEFRNVIASLTDTGKKR
ncbi:MAG: flagellar protein FlaG [Acidobacteria bacterium]|nr:flagellar protein FlaG [Acidobacteriota bacterium]